MKGKPVDQAVYDYIYPRTRRRPQDPGNFQALLQQHLVLEVRQEVHSFYGHLDTSEAKYPGLDYTNPTHRLRLSRWPFHRRLFCAFDDLQLTPAEIAALTKWEGTRWAKERYEKEQGIVIRDTTADELPQWVHLEDRPAGWRHTMRQSSQQTTAASPEHGSDDDTGSDWGEELESVGIALNERLRERVAARNAGDTSMPLDEEWEQWLKNLMEAEDMSLNADHLARLSSSSGLVTPGDLFLPRMVAAARIGQWDEIPGILHQVIRQRLEHESSRQQPQNASTPRASSHHQERVIRVNTANPAYPAWRRTYSGLRLPGTAARTRTTAPGARLPPTAQAPGA